jgi:predicted metal-binding protein
MTKRKFYKTVYQVTVLSEEPVNFESLTDIAAAITDGDCSGEYTTTSSETINGKQAADALKAQRSDPGFFMLDDDGNNL